MKKQFIRVKQFADQTFSRGGKTELLSDDLAEVDKHVEFLKNATTNVTKKLSNSLLINAGIDDPVQEKRLKKCPEFLLGRVMQESTSGVDHPLLLTETLNRCGGLSIALAHALVDYDINVEQSVVNPLQSIVDNDIPVVVKHKRNLQKFISDMDAAKARYHAVLKHGSGQTQAKIDTLKEELEEAEYKVEQARDSLVAEMYQFITKESDIAKIFSHYIQLQMSYHTTALKYLEKIAPEMNTFINDSNSKPVFGLSLEEHLRVTNRKIAVPIELCVCALLELGMNEEGLFRVAGGASKVKRMRLSMDAGYLNFATILELSDPNVVAGVLKSYLRELPEPLLTFSLYNSWISAVRLQGVDEIKLALKTVIERLPEANYDNLQYLIKFLSKLAKNQEINKMSAQNIAIVIAPNIIWDPEQDQTGGMNMTTANIHSFIVDNLVSYADYFFPTDVEFFQTIQAGEEKRNGGHSRSSSDDTILINASEIKRSQSNSSLTDHSSPPHSPKPITRRKNKIAPNPPRMNDAPPPRPLSAHIVSATTHVVTTISSPTMKKPPEPSAPPPKPVIPPTTISIKEENLININNEPVMVEPETTTPHKVVNNEIVKNINPHPVAAPRTIIQNMPDGEGIEKIKPAIPERPAALKTSFRQSAELMIRSVDEKPEPAVRPINIQEKRSSIEKPERPRKPDVLLPTVLPNDDSDDDFLSGTSKSGRLPGISKPPPRPQPPPPPPPSIKQKTVSTMSQESTDL